MNLYTGDPVSSVWHLMTLEEFTAQLNGSTFWEEFTFSQNKFSPRLGQELELADRVVLSAGTMAINGKIQKEGDVVHLVARQLFDFSEDLAGLGERDVRFPLRSGRGDEFASGSAGSPDSRDRPKPPMQARDILIPDLHIDTLKVKSRNFQ